MYIRLGDKEEVEIPHQVILVVTERICSIRMAK